MQTSLLTINKKDFKRYLKEVTAIPLDFSKIEERVNRRPTKQLEKLEAKNHQLQIKNQQLQIKYQRFQQESAYLNSRIATNLPNGDQCHAINKN